MRKNLKKISAFAIALALTLSLMIVPANAATVADVGALWDGYTAGSGTFKVTESSRVFVVGTSAPTGGLLQTAQLIQRELRAQFGESYFKDLVWGPESYAKTGDIVLKTASNIGADGYKLNVTATTATITAGTSDGDIDGLIYGANNLMKCFRAVGGNSLSGFTGNDTPDTKERTVHLDLARKYYTVEWVKNFIRQMSWMGYNALELHLSEDGGFRADFWDPTYYTDNYKPANDFSWLCGSHVQSWVYNETLPDGTTGNYKKDPDAGKYLTTAELVQICNVAKEYHIEIIPSFDSPAHMDYITWRFEQYYKEYVEKNQAGFTFTYGGKTYKSGDTNGCINYTGKTGASSPTWPYYTTIDITDGTMAKAFVFALYEDMADFFKEYAGSTNFNIGADEVNLSSSYGPKWSYSQFPGYVNSLNQMLRNKGYTVRMYNDFIGSTTYNQEYDTSEGISDYNSIYDFDKNIEICYWNSDYNPTSGVYDEAIWHAKFFWEKNTGTYHNWGDGGRTMYNCIQTNTYYVLRIGTSGNNRDARDPSNRNWTFYGTNEADIYNNWYPADISEKGVYSEDAADVPADQLGGAYFLIWNDYAALNTESQVWNGALDGWDKDRTYYLFDIMASNIVKMWNADINDKVTYSKFAEVREATLEWFPGFTSCSKAASLPAATAATQAYAADHSGLEAALATKITGGDYTSASYAAYEKAYDEAVALNAKYEATAEEISAAIANLNAAKAALVDLSTLRAEVTNKVSNVDGKYTADSYDAYTAADTAAQAVLADTDATKEEVDKALSALKLAKAALVDRSVLLAAVDPEKKIGNVDANNEAIYTEETYSAYEAAYKAAVEVANDGAATTEQIGKALEDLTNAQAGLVPIKASVFEVESLSSVGRIGKRIGFKVTTSVDVTALTVKIDGTVVTPKICAGKAQELKDGQQVKIWLVEVDAPATAATYTYMISDNVNSETGTIEVK